MIVIFIAAGLLAVIGAAVLGREFGRTRLPPTQSGPDGSKPDGCEDASKQWDAARQMACNAKRDQDAAQLIAADLRAQVIAATAVHVALVIAAAVTYAAAAAAIATIFGIPAGLVLTGVAIGLTVAAAAALLVVIGLTGSLTAADDDLLAKIRVRQAWDAEVARLRAAILSACPPETANAVLARPGPC
jgi:hypothetical protein